MGGVQNVFVRSLRFELLCVPNSDPKPAYGVQNELGHLGGAWWPSFRHATRGLDAGIHAGSL